MKAFKFICLILLTGLIFSCADDETISSDPKPELYFPPAEHDIWDSVTIENLGWNAAKLDDLGEYLEDKNSKGFIILKDGKIAYEAYFDGHDIHKNWNWFSAAKSLTSTIAGVASMEGLLDVDEKTSEYLGDNWSSAPNDKQDLITVRNHLTMTTGLVNNQTDIGLWTCTAPLCMQYEVDAGSRWAYHQGAFTLTQDIITSVVEGNFKQYCKEKILDKIGMNGSWQQLFDLRIFSSTTRSMARFGLLALNKGLWDEEVIYPESYYDSMTESSQDLNRAYGYLWWLNGKSNFLGTADQTLFSGSLIPNAPSDMFCALGLDDQKIYVVPSENMVVVRCGDAAGNPEFAGSSFDNELWGKINEVIR